MKFERVDDKTIRCFISNEELEDYQIDYKDFVLRSEKAREVVRDIITQAPSFPSVQTSCRSYRHVCWRFLVPLICILLCSDLILPHFRWFFHLQFSPSPDLISCGFLIEFAKALSVFLILRRCFCHFLFCFRPSLCHLELSCY